MDAIKTILVREIQQINQQERRDGKARFNTEFFTKHPLLCLAMLAGYVAVGVVMYYAPYMGLGWFAGFTAFLVLVSGGLLLDIKPVYRYEDIGVLDLRVCYNGEWYFSREVPVHAVEEILAHPQVAQPIKARMQEIIRHKGAIDFYDIYDLARKQARQPAPLAASGRQQQPAH
ncbi:MAG: YlaC family protein [Yersiniaceae bacterium]|uniref:Inner membrane protein YlaC n=1 Tax=Chimaeribacter coloradensis TaxID=2060068 RepID=A0A2N5ECV2_9GAMM|nr:YlaC family protein [Chimaeribacter coloradensis]MDU6410779.1 YlaC family protein [Yersiniaceae bacterium]PLR40363.1 hypothetical protein CYR32_01075 [Chimaeribacter coloradensis]